MVKEVSCIHAGIEDCAFLIRSEDEAEVIEFTQKHAERAHDKSVSAEHVENIMIDA